jgi:hypothetical protein
MCADDRYGDVDPFAITRHLRDLQRRMLPDVSWEAKASRQVDAVLSACSSEHRAKAFAEAVQAARYN